MPDARGGPARDRWEKAASGYGVPHLRLRQVAAVVAQLAPRRLVDVGCADGFLRTLCPDVEYVGCDFVAPRGGAAFPFFPCDFNRDPLPEGIRDMDAAVCSGILEYVEDLPAFLAQLHSRLRPGGTLVATYFNMNHVSRVLALARGKSLPVHPDWRGFHSLRAVADFIGGAGFSVTRTIAMNHSLRQAAPVGDTVALPLALPAARPWSFLLAHQFLFVAGSRP